jgi:hypothetical protein
MSLVDLSINPYPILSSYYSGLFYAFIAQGGYTLAQGFDTIKLAIEEPITQYDITQAVQVQFDVRTFNTKLGTLKDANNINVTDTTYNPALDRYPVDTITLSAAEFVAGMSASQVISVGTYSSMYSDFNYYVNTYFGYAGGFSSLFSYNTSYDYNNGIFDADSFMNLITEQTIDASGAYVNKVTGSITIYNVNSLLRYAVDSNVFGNRDPVNGETASDPSNRANYGLEDGFVDGDLILIPAGTNVTLTLAIDQEALLPINNIGPNNVAALNDLSSFITKYNNNLSNYYSESSSATRTQIQRVLTAPLVLRLTNLSTA